MTRDEHLADLVALQFASTSELRDLTPNEQEAWDRTMAAIRVIDQGKAMEVEDALEQPTNPTRRLEAPAIVRREPVTQSAILRSAIGLASRDPSIDPGLAREVHDETRRRSPWQRGDGVSLPASVLLGVEKAIGALSGGAAEDLRGTAYFDSLFFRADDAIVGPRIAQALGVSTIVGTEERLHVSKLTGQIVPTWIARDGDVPDTDAAFDAVEVTPKSVGCNVLVKRSALLYANHPSVEPIVRSEMRDGMLKALDNAVLYGAGTLAPVGVASVAQTGPTLSTLANAYAIRGLLIAYQKSDEGMRFLLPDTTEAKLSTTVAFTGSTVAAMQDGKLAGYPVVVSGETPAGVANGTKSYLAGNFGYVHLVVWDSIQILANPFGAGYKSGSIELRILADANVFVRDAKRIFKGDASV